MIKAIAVLFGIFRVTHSDVTGHFRLTWPGPFEGDAPENVTEVVVGKEFDA